MIASSLDVPEQTMSRANSSFDTERHEHHNRQRQGHVGLTIAPGITTSPVWSDLPSRISEGHYRIRPNTITAPFANTNIRAAYQDSGVRPSTYNKYSHPSSYNDEDHRNEHGTMLPLVDHPSNNTIPPDWPYQVGPSQPVLLRNFNSPISANSRQRFYSPSEMIPRKRSRLTQATYLILLALLISSTTAAFLFFSGQKYEQSNKVTSAMTTSSPSSNPVLVSSSRTSNTDTDSKQQNSPSSASYAYYYYYYYPSPTSPSGIDQSGGAVSNPMTSPSSTAVKNSTMPSLSLIKTNFTTSFDNSGAASLVTNANVTTSIQPNNGSASNGTGELSDDDSLESKIETKQLVNVTNNGTANVQTPVGTPPTPTTYSTTSTAQSNNDDPFPADSLNDDRIRTGDDVTNILSSANNIEVDKVTGAITTVDDATSKVTTLSGNDKTDDDPISMYPTSDTRAGTNLTFQGYDDGFDDSVHDDAFSADDTLGNGEYKNQFNTALTGSTGAEFLPQQSAGSSNFDFGEKADDFAKESSANNDFDSSLSNANLNSGDDFSVGDSERSGDDFQSIIDGISSSIIKYSPSNQTSSNLTTTDESFINNNGSINFTNESSNLNYTAPTSKPPTTPTTNAKSSLTITPSMVLAPYAPSTPLATLPMKDTNIVTPTQPVTTFISFSPSMKVKKGKKGFSAEPSPSFRPVSSPLYVITSMQPKGPSKPSVTITPVVVIQPPYRPSNSPTMIPIKDTYIFTPTNPAHASIPSFSPSVKKGINEVSALPSPSARPGTLPLYLIPSMQPAGPPAGLSVSYIPSVSQPIYAPRNPPTTVSTKDTNIVTPIHPVLASINFFSPSVIKRVSSVPSPSFTPEFVPILQPALSSPRSSSPTIESKKVPGTVPSLWQPASNLQNSMSPSKEYLIPPILSAGNSTVTGAPSSTKLNLHFSPGLPPLSLSGGGYYYYYYYYTPTSRRKR